MRAYMLYLIILAETSIISDASYLVPHRYANNIISPAISEPTLKSCFMHCHNQMKTNREILAVTIHQSSNCYCVKNNYQVYYHPYAYYLYGYLFPKPMQIPSSSYNVSDIITIDVTFYIELYSLHKTHLFAVHDINTYPIQKSGRVIYGEMTEISQGTTYKKTAYRTNTSKLINHVELTYPNDTTVVFRRDSVSVEVADMGLMGNENLCLTIVNENNEILIIDSDAVTIGRSSKSCDLLIYISKTVKDNLLKISYKLAPQSSCNTDMDISSIQFSNEDFLKPTKVAFNENYANGSIVIKERNIVIKVSLSKHNSTKFTFVHFGSLLAF